MQIHTTLTFSNPKSWYFLGVVFYYALNVCKLVYFFYVRGSLIMFCNLVCQQHLQPLYLLQFFEEIPLSMYTFDHPHKPAVYDTRPRWLGYVQKDALKECSGIFGVLKLLSLQLPFDGREQNQSQRAKSGEYGEWVTSWTSLVARKSRVTAAVCTLALSWLSSRPRTPVRGHRFTVFLSSSGIVVTWPNFAKKHAIICLEALLFLLNFTDPCRWLLLCLGVVLAYLYFVSCFDVPNARRPSSVKFSQHLGVPVHSTLLLLFTQLMGHPAGTTFPYAKAVVKNASETSRWTLHDILYFSVCHFWVLLNQRLYVIFGFFLIRDSTFEMFSG